MESAVVAALLASSITTVGSIAVQWVVNNAASARHARELRQKTEEAEAKGRAETLKSIYLPFWDDLTGAVGFLTKISVCTPSELAEMKSLTNTGSHAARISAIGPQELSEAIVEAVQHLSRISGELVTMRIGIDGLATELDAILGEIDHASKKSIELEENITAIQKGEQISGQQLPVEELQMCLMFVMSRLEGLNREHRQKSQKELQAKLGLQLEVISKLEGWQAYQMAVIIEMRKQIGAPPLNEERFRRFSEQTRYEVKKFVNKYHADLEKASAENSKMWEEREKS